MDDFITGQAYKPQNSAPSPPSQSSEERYPMLRLASKIYKYGAILSGLGGLFIVIVGIAEIFGYFGIFGDLFPIWPTFDRISGILWIIIGIFESIVGPITCLAIGEGITVFLDIEKNTRGSNRRN